MIKILKYILPILCFLFTPQPPRAPFLCERICPCSSSNSTSVPFLQLTLVTSVWILIAVRLWTLRWLVCWLSVDVLEDQPSESHPSHANNLANALHQALGDVTASHKTVVTFTFPLTLPLRSATDSHYLRTLSSCTRSIELVPWNIFQTAGLSTPLSVFMDVWLLLVCQSCRHVNMF